MPRAGRIQLGWRRGTGAPLYAYSARSRGRIPTERNRGSAPGIGVGVALAAVIGDGVPARGERVDDRTDAGLDALVPLGVVGVEIVRLVNAGEAHRVDVAVGADLQARRRAGHGWVVPPGQERRDVVHVVGADGTPVQPGTGRTGREVRLGEQGGDAVDQAHAVVAVRVFVARSGEAEADRRAARAAGVAVVAGRALRDQGACLPEQGRAALSLGHVRLSLYVTERGQAGLRPGQLVTASQAVIGIEGEDVVALQVGEVTGTGL